jgi:hypothetical protein
MATAFSRLNTEISSGVISEPPPTPVTPTISPMPNPAAMASQSIVKPRVSSM